MKIFIYKTIIIVIAFFLLFEITINSKIKQINRKIDSYTSSTGREKIKETILKEMESAVDKENYFTQRERKTIYNFLNKITNEINNADK